MPQCDTCQDLVAKDGNWFSASIEDINQSSERCAICLVLSQASGKYQSIIKYRVLEIEIRGGDHYSSPVLLLRGDESWPTALRIFYTGPGLQDKPFRP